MELDFAIDRTGRVDPKHAALYKALGDWIRRPVQPEPFRVLVLSLAARTLNAIGRFTGHSIAAVRALAACGPRQEERGAELCPKRRFLQLLRFTSRERQHFHKAAWWGVEHRD